MDINAFYLLINELLNKIQNNMLTTHKYKSLFQRIVNGQMDVYLKRVSIGLISDGEFERYDAMRSIIQELQSAQNQLGPPVNTGNQYFNNTANIFTGKDDQGNRRMLFWCRYVDELFLGDDLDEEEDVGEQRVAADTDFLSY